jgi:hypothetical protein
MRSNAVSSCIARVVVDGHPAAELAEVQFVMQRIQSAMRDLVPSAQQSYIGNALLNLAVGHLLRETGAQRTATILIRLVDAVVENDEPPPPEAAIDLTATHS